MEMGDIDGDGDIAGFDVDPFLDILNDNALQARRFEYDEENRLVAVLTQDESPLLEIEYDALGRPIATYDYTAVSDPWAETPSMVATRHIYAGLEVVKEHVWCSGEPVCDPGGEWVLACEFVWGERLPES